MIYLNFLTSKQLIRLQRIGSGREEYENIRSELDNLFEDLQGHFKRMISTELTKSMEGLCK